MRSHYFHSFLVAACFCLLAGAVVGQSNAPTERSASFGMKAGFIFGGTVDFESKGSGAYNGDFDTKESYSLGVFLDFPFYKALHAQLNLDIHDFALESKLSDASENLLLGSVGLRYVHFTEDKRLAIRPGASIGYGYLTDVGITDATTHVISVVSSEFVFYPGQKTGILAELGLLWDISGGNDEYDVTGGPMLLIRGGLIF